MLITRVELQNTRSYRDQTVTFAEGTNAICGENGAGKSTLLAAIGFALFNHLTNTQSEFVREGERTATIGVHFVSSADGRTYHVVRKCGGSSEYYVYDPELKARVVTGRADVMDWLKEHMGVDPSTDLTSLFQDAIGVPQGLLTAAFQLRPSDRKPTFDRLLQVQDYESAHKKLKDTLDHMKAVISDTEQRIAVLNTRLARLPTLRDQAQALQREVQASAGRLAELAADVEQVTARRTALTEVKQALDELTETIRRQETQLEGLTNLLAEAQQAADQAAAAREVLEASRPGYEAYNRVRQALDGLENQRRERDQQREQAARHERNRDLAAAEIERLTNDLNQAVEAAAKMAALVAQVERQTALEQQLREAHERLQTHRLLETQAAEREKQLAEAQARLAGIQRDLAASQELEAALAANRAEQAATRQSQTEITEKQAALKAEAERLKGQSASLEATESANCPVCEQPLTGDHRRELLERNKNQIETLRAEYGTLNHQLAVAKQREKELEAEATRLEARLRQLARPAERDELVERIEVITAQLTDTRKRLAELSDEPARAAALEQELVALGDPRRESDGLALVAGQRAGIEQRLAAKRQDLQAANEALATLNEQLRAFADLDGQMDGLRTELQRHEADHRRYLESARLAEELPARTHRVATLQAQHAALAEQIEGSRAQRARVAAGFDADELTTLTQREDSLKREHAQLQGRLGVQRQQLADLEAEIEQLEAETGTLAVAQAEVSEQKALLSTIEFLRGVIRSAGPHIIRRTVQRVSLQASRLFGAIMADYTARLNWAEDYGITLETDGRQRDFDQLSGGEQMAAALAIRLALLRELSSVDVAFFDEPTSNLDSTRRDNLAQQILAIRDAGFAQLFVISHDDTFEQVTNHVVRVRKEHGESIVEIG